MMDVWTRHGAWIVAGIVVAVGFWFSNAGYVNGDAAIYHWQGLEGRFDERTPHLGYVLLASLLRSRWYLDLSVTVAAAALVLAAGVGMKERAGSAAVLASTAVLPFAAYGEVDLLWTALLAWAPFVPAPAAALLAALAVSFSPSALLALPLVIAMAPSQPLPRAAWAVAGASATVLAISVAYGGDWWVGDRGVLRYTPNPLETLRHAPRMAPIVLLLWSAMRDPRLLLLSLPLWFAPSDAPVWGLFAMAFGRSDRPVQRALWLQLPVTAFFTLSEARRVEGENELARGAASALGDRDLLVAPWSLGVRASLYRDRIPYSRMWRAWPVPVRDQHASTCARDWERVLVVPEDLAPQLPRDDVAAVRKMLGCAEPMPNLVLVIGCTVREDRLGPETTPYLWDWREHAASFEDVIAAAPWTRPSVTTLFTGFHALSLGTTEPGPHPDERVLPAEVNTLAERLGARGYFTVAVTANPNVSARFGLDQGYEVFEALSPTWAGGVVKVPGVVVAADAVDRVNQKWDRSKPLFLTVVLTDPHAPLGEGPQLVAYDEALGRLDLAVRKLEEYLAGIAVTERETVFAFVADHGEGLNLPPDNGRAHGRHLTPEVLSVPLWFTGRGIEAPRRIPGQYSHLDVLPTLLGLVGAPTDGLPGVDASGALRGRDAPVRDGPVFADTWFLDRSRAAAYTGDHWCQIERSATPEQIPGPTFVEGCFDRASHAPVEAPDTMAALSRWRAEEEARWETAQQAIVPAGADVENERQLRALGYVQ